MSRVWGSVLVLGLALVPLPAPAARYDGSTPLICAATTVLECDEGGECRRLAAGESDLPTFIRIDAVRKTIGAMDRSGRKAVIERVAQVSGHTVLQGAETGEQGARGWSLLVGTESGELSATVAGDGVGFVIFGACTDPESGSAP